MMAGIDVAAIENFERKLAKPDKEVITKIETALEVAGVVFIAENGGGAGVRQ